MSGEAEAKRKRPAHPVLECAGPRVCQAELELQPQRELTEPAFVVVAAESRVSEATLRFKDLFWASPLKEVVFSGEHVVVMVVKSVKAFGTEEQMEALR